MVYILFQGWGAGYWRNISWVQHGMDHITSDAVGMLISNNVTLQGTERSGYLVSMCVHIKCTLRYEFRIIVFLTHVSG